MDFKLELVLIPVSDVDRAKAFYVTKAGFELQVDTTVGDQMRVVQVTPPGSACSIGFGTGLTPAPPGSAQGLHRHRGRAGRTRRLRGGRQRGAAHGVGYLGTGAASAAGKLRVVRRVRRPGRQRLGAAGGQPGQAGGLTGHGSARPRAACFTAFLYTQYHP